MLRAIIGAGVLLSSGCAYFHPAFVIHPSPLRSNAAASGERGVLVCERYSLTRKDCTVMPYSEAKQLLFEALGHY
jgi:hypothetical protein